MNPADTNDNSILFFPQEARVYFKAKEYSSLEMGRLVEFFEKQLESHYSRHPIVLWIGKNHPSAIALYLACVKIGLWFHCSQNLETSPLRQLRENHFLLLFSEDDQNARLMEPLMKPLMERRENSSGAGGLLLPSSGTNAQPKLCRLPWTMSRANAKAADDLLQISKRTSAVVWSSFATTAGWNTLLLPCLRRGIPVELHEEFNAFSALKALREKKNSLFHFSPLQAKMVTSLSGWGSVGNDTGNICIVGSTDVSPGVIRSLQNKNLTVVRNYGLTEVGPYVFAKYSAPHNQEDPDLMDLGHLVSGLEQRLEPLANSAEFFTLALKGDSVFQGYLGQEDLAASDWFETKDVVSLAQGKVYFQARAANVFQIQGKNVFPNFLEQAILEELPALWECCISKVRPSNSAEGVHVTIGGHHTSDLTQPITSILQRHLNLTNFSVQLSNQRRIPRNSAGKILRRDLDCLL